MKYKYSPLIKYFLLLIIIMMFMKHQEIMTTYKLITNSLLITMIIITFDYIIIDEHPFITDGIMTNDIIKISDTDIDDIIDMYEESEKEKDVMY